MWDGQDKVKKNQNLQGSNWACRFERGTRDLGHGMEGGDDNTRDSDFSVMLAKKA